MKNRVRMIVVLVCVFVVLPVVGGLVYSFSVSAEAAVRYYAEAIAQGRFEDAMGVETAELLSEVGEVPDLRRGRVWACGASSRAPRTWRRCGRMATLPM